MYVDVYQIIAYKICTVLFTLTLDFILNKLCKPSKYLKLLTMLCYDADMAHTYLGIIYWNVLSISKGIKCRIINYLNYSNCG